MESIVINGIECRLSMAPRYQPAAPGAPNASFKLSQAEVITRANSTRAMKRLLVLDLQTECLLEANQARSRTLAVLK